MFRNYLTIALRGMIRQRAHFFINLFGLAVGIAACIIILLYVQNELSYDRYLKDHERIFRVSRSWNNADGQVNLHLGHLAPPFGPLLKLDYAGSVEQSVRLYNHNPLIIAGDSRFEEDDFFFADPEVLEVFSWNMVQGDAETALDDPYSVILTKSVALKYFNSENPMGKTIGYGELMELKVTGVIEDIPSNSHFHPTMLAPMVLVQEYYGGPEAFMSAWGSNNFSTFVKLKEGVDPKEFEAQLPGFFDRHFDVPEVGKASDYNKLSLMNIADIHLHSHLDSEIEQNGDIAYVSLFAIIAVFILAIACINYVNLATARSARRSREVGVRKVLGANRQRLIKQFLSESMLFAILALVLACLIVSLLLPWFNSFSQRALSLDLVSNPVLVVILIMITAATGLIAGIYPAIFLSSFQPAKVLKGVAGKGGKVSLRSALVVFQFFI
jgi:putative ABC transport system permease protein